MRIHARVEPEVDVRVNRLAIAMVSQMYELVTIAIHSISLYALIALVYHEFDDIRYFASRKWDFSVDNPNRINFYYESYIEENKQDYEIKGLQRILFAQPMAFILIIVLFFPL